MIEPVPAQFRKWEQRIARARTLANAHPSAAQFLTFYATLTAFQQDAYRQIQSAFGAGPRSKLTAPRLEDPKWALLLPMFRPFLRVVGREGPAPLAAFALDLETRDSSVWAELLSSFWRAELAPAGADQPKPAEASSLPTSPSPAEQEARCAFEDFLARAFLQPYLEYLAEQLYVPAPDARPSVCPFCKAKPLLGVLRPEGEGAKRSLVCSLCRTEWDYARLRCPACEESRDEKLRVYTTEGYAHVRVEACETCRNYLQTVDLSKDGFAVPEVDDLAAIPLTLWADEHGYRKLTRNTLGL